MTPPLLLSTSDVASLFGLRLRELNWWIYALDEHKRYKRFLISKRSGNEFRVIEAPIKPIRDMQKILVDVLTDAYEPISSVHGFVPGRSPRSNAERHTNQEWVLRVDLEDFFPSIHFGRVRGMFRRFPFEYPDDVAIVLAQVCCHRGRLPQGAPTSPMVSNLICRSLDKALQRLARLERCFYSRYADDICFSTKRWTFPGVLAEQDADGLLIVGDKLRGIIEENGFRVNHSKTRLMRRTQRQRVTGLVVNEWANISQDYVRDIRNVLFIWRTHGEAAAAERFALFHPQRSSPDAKADPDFSSVVAGRIQHIGSVRGWTHSSYRRLAKTLHSLDPSFDPRTLRELGGPVSVVLYTEGESDILHFTAALESFHDGGEFANLQLQLVDKSACGNDSQLFAMAQALKETPQRSPCICVFDRDVPEMVRKAVGPAGVRLYGNGVATLAIVTPFERAHEERICIEMLYRDDDLARRDNEGRRVYLLSEFNPRTAQHHTDPVNTPQPNNKALVRDEVYEFGTSKSLALGKMAFARYVADKTPPFDEVSFEGFRRTFEVLQETAARIVDETSS